VSRLPSHALLIAALLAVAALAVGAAYWQGCAHGTRAERARWERDAVQARGEADSLRAVAAAHVDAAAEWERLALLLADSLTIQRDSTARLARSLARARDDARASGERADEARVVYVETEGQPDSTRLAACDRALGACTEARRAASAALDTAAAVIASQGEEIGLLTRQTDVLRAQGESWRLAYDASAAESSALRLQLVGVEALAARYRRQRPLYAVVGFAAGAGASFLTCRAVGC